MQAALRAAPESRTVATAGPLSPFSVQYIPPQGKVTVPSAEVVASDAVKAAPKGTAKDVDQAGDVSGPESTDNDEESDGEDAEHAAELRAQVLHDGDNSEDDGFVPEDGSGEEDDIVENGVETTVADAKETTVAEPRRYPARKTATTSGTSKHITCCMAVKDQDDYRFLFTPHPLHHAWRWRWLIELVNHL